MDKTSERRPLLHANGEPGYRAIDTTSDEVTDQSRVQIQDNVLMIKVGYSSCSIHHNLQGFFFVSSGAEIRPLSQWDLGDFFPNLKKKWDLGDFFPNLKKKPQSQKKKFIQPPHTHLQATW